MSTYCSELKDVDTNIIRFFWQPEFLSHSLNPITLLVIRRIIKIIRFVHLKRFDKSRVVVSDRVKRMPTISSKDTHAMFDNR